MIEFIVKILKVLNSETEPGQISLGLCFSMILGLTPLFSIHNILVLFLALVLRVNLSMFLLGFVVFSGLAYLLDPLFHRLGFWILTTGFLESFWTGMYQTTLFRLGNLNHTITMGSLLFSLALFMPFFLVVNYLIRQYREHILAWVLKLKLVQSLRASRLYEIFQSVTAHGRHT